MLRRRVPNILVILGTIVLLTIPIYATLFINHQNHTVRKKYVYCKYMDAALRDMSTGFRNGTESPKSWMGSSFRVRNKSSTFNVRFKFDIPLRKFVVANDTGLPDARRGNITAINTGDIAVIVRFKYRASPPNRNISIKFSNNNITLYPGDKAIVGVNISVEKHTVSGEYNVTIIASALRYPETGPNPITLTQEYTFYVTVGGKACSFTVRLWQPEKKKETQPWALMRIFYIYAGFENEIYRYFGPNATFYVVAGHYKIEVWYYGRMRAYVKINIISNQMIVLEESNVDVEINGNIVDIIFSLITIRDIVPIFRQLRTKTESFIFKFTVRNDDPLIYENVIKIHVYLYKKADGSLLGDKDIAELTIRSRMVEDVIGALDAPEDGWENDTYIVRLVAYKTRSGGIDLANPVVVANVSSEVQIEVIITAPIVEVKYIPLPPLLLAGLIAGLIGFLTARGTTKMIKPKSYAPFKIRRIGVIARGSLIGLYDFMRKVAMIMNEIDRHYPSLIALIRGMESLRPPSWVMETPLPITWNIWAEKFLIYPIDSEFSLLVSTDPRVNERDPKVIRTLQTLADYVGRMHRESRLTYDYIMKHQREYRLNIRRIADMVREMGLAVKPTRERR